ncbi:MAG: pyruvate kinase, partial [Actinomycetota bacterium]
MRKTKIVATVGPASSSPEGIASLVEAGADVLRLNCSHLTTEALRQAIVDVRSAAPGVAVLVDIQGPKMRYSGEERTLTDRETLQLGTHVLGLDNGLRRSEDLGLQVGQRVLMDDGRIECRISSLVGTEVGLLVVRGGLLRRNKGVNLPDTEVFGGVLSTKDIADIEAAREGGAEIVAISFVQHPDDVTRVRSMVGPDMLVIAKIERPQALDRLEAICSVSDGVMAARGDLGVELPYEELPTSQHAIALTALRMGKVSI